jgi:hypothetical protein
MATESASPKSSRLKWLKRLLLLSASVVVAGLFLELAVSVLLGTQVRFPRHVVEAPWGIRYNEPGSSYWHTSADICVQFRINAQGMRADEDFAYDKPPGTKRVLCLGDSYTIGYEVEAEQCFANLLADHLNESDDACVQVLNAGVSGFGNAEEAIYLERELLKYKPDAVVVSFFINDLDDNVRSGLFDVAAGQLVSAGESYVPLGAAGNFLNRNMLCSFLSEHSNAFALLKEVVTKFVKSQLIKKSLEGVAKDPLGADDHRAVLAVKILDRIYAICHSRGIPLIVQNIPWGVNGRRLVDHFPKDGFDLDRAGLHYIAAKDFLAPHFGEVQLYHARSHGHWTPFAHALSAKRLAGVVSSVLSN